MIKIPKDRYLSVKDYAKEAELSCQAIYNAISQNRLKAYKISGIWLIPADSLIVNRKVKHGNQIGVSNLRRGDLEGFLAKRGIEFD